MGTDLLSSISLLLSSNRLLCLSPAFTLVACLAYYNHRCDNLKSNFCTLQLTTWVGKRWLKQKSAPAGCRFPAVWPTVYWGRYAGSFCSNGTFLCKKRCLKYAPAAEGDTNQHVEGSLTSVDIHTCTFQFLPFSRGWHKPFTWQFCSLIMTSGIHLNLCLASSGKGCALHY
jgi:hypothetical protein